MVITTDVFFNYLSFSLAYVIYSIIIFGFWNNWHVSTVTCSLYDKNNLSLVCRIIIQKKSMSTYVYYTKSKAHVEHHFFCTCHWHGYLNGLFLFCLAICLSFVFCLLFLMGCFLTATRVCLIYHQKECRANIYLSIHTLKIVKRIFVIKLTD